MKKNSESLKEKKKRENLTKILNLIDQLIPDKENMYICQSKFRDTTLQCYAYKNTRYRSEFPSEHDDIHIAP